MNGPGARERLSCLLGAEPEQLPLEGGEALRLCTEARRLVAVAAGYGQACQLYLDLYPAVVQELQSVLRLLGPPSPPGPPGPSDPPGPLLALQVQRIQALLVLLTQVTQTAGCHQELQAAVLSSQGEPCPPPPPVSWTQVSGLQVSLTGHLKALIRTLDDPAQRDGSLALIPPYLLYLHAYYQQLSRQSCFRPVETLEEVELLASGVLLPLLGHGAVQNQIRNLRRCSAVCGAAPVAPELTASLPGRAGPGWRGRPGPAGPGSPFPLLTALAVLMDTVCGIHKALCPKFSSLLLLEAVLLYLQSCSRATPTMTHGSMWLLRHEHHLLYLLLRLAQRLVPVVPAVARHAGLFHQVALVLLPWLLPGSEFLAQELLSGVVFSRDFIPEGWSGGPEAAELEELTLQEERRGGGSPSPPTAGALLREACVQLPSVRGCFLRRLARPDAAARASRDAVLGRTPRVSSHLLPEPAGPAVPADWPFLPLVGLYERTGAGRGGGPAAERLPPGALRDVTLCLQWLLLLEAWRPDALQVVPPVAKLARLSCVFLCSSDLFLEPPVQRLTWALFRLMSRGSRLDSVDLSVAPPGLASFEDLYRVLLWQYEAVSFGDRLFGCWLLLPLQRRYSATMRLAVFGEHVGVLRSLGVTPEQLSIPLERFTSPPEDSLPLLRLYLRALVTGALRPCWCPVLYVVALAHVNAFVFCQDAAAQEVETARLSMLRKIYCLTDEVLRKHLLFFRLPQQHLKLGFDMYEELPPIRTKRLESVAGPKDSGAD